MKLTEHLNLLRCVYSSIIYIYVVGIQHSWRVNRIVYSNERKDEFHTLLSYSLELFFTLDLIFPLAFLTRLICTRWVNIEWCFVVATGFFHSFFSCLDSIRLVSSSLPCHCSQQLAVSTVSFSFMHWLIGFCGLVDWIDCRGNLIWLMVTVVNLPYYFCYILWYCGWCSFM